MAGPYRVKRPVDGKRRVERFGVLVAMLYETSASDTGHTPEAPWCLETVQGRVERYGYFDEARSAAYKL